MDRVEREKFQFDSEGDRLARRDKWADAIRGLLHAPGFDPPEVISILERAAEKEKQR